MKTLKEDTRKNVVKVKGRTTKIKSAKIPVPATNNPEEDEVGPDKTEKPKTGKKKTKV